MAIHSWVASDKRDFHMFANLSDARGTAASFAAAFITAMLFVSAAVGPLPIA
jgi:hypothetical protein